MRNNKHHRNKRSKQSKKKQNLPPFRPIPKTDVRDSIYEEPIQLVDMGDQEVRNRQIEQDIARMDLDLEPLSESDKQEARKIMEDAE